MPVILSPPQGLQKQICDLAAEVSRQASWWCVAHRDLQSQIDALMKENQELREELKALKQQSVGAAKSSVALPPAARATDTLVQQTFCIAEIMAQGGMSPPLQACCLPWALCEGLVSVSQS